MTVLVGVRCSDGVVVGADSMATSSAGPHPLMRMTSDKLVVVGGRIILAGTGAVGLGQRFQNIVQKAWNEKAFQKSCVDCSRGLAQQTVADFNSTGVPRTAHGWGFGALLAAPLDDKAELVEFGILDFQPEIKQDKLHFVSMGSGQMLAEPFMGFISRVFWGGSMPDVQSARLGVYWALRHAIQIAPGGVGAPIRIAVLKRENGQWKASILEDGELDEVDQHIEAIEGRIRRYPVESVEKAEAKPLPEPPSPK